jgi:hypothetical protein
MKANLLTLISRVRAVCTVRPYFWLIGIYQRAGSLTDPWSAFLDDYAQIEAADPQVAFAT